MLSSRECYLGYTPAAGQEAAVRSLIQRSLRRRTRLRTTTSTWPRRRSSMTWRRLQSTERSQFGYKRAAKAIVGLPVLVADLVAAGTLRDVEFVGPASARIVTELVEQGRSPTVEAALAKSTKAPQVALAPSIPRVVPQPRGPAAGAGRAARRRHRQPRRVPRRFSDALDVERWGRTDRDDGGGVPAPGPQLPRASPTTRTAFRSRAASPWRTSRGSIARSTS